MNLVYKRFYPYGYHLPMLSNTPSDSLLNSTKELNLKQIFRYERNYYTHKSIYQ